MKMKLRLLKPYKKLFGDGSAIDLQPGEIETVDMPTVTIHVQVHTAEPKRLVTRKIKVRLNDIWVTQQPI